MHQVAGAERPAVERGAAPGGPHAGAGGGLPAAPQRAQAPREAGARAGVVSLPPGRAVCHCPAKDLTSRSPSHARPLRAVHIQCVSQRNIAFIVLIITLTVIAILIIYVWVGWGGGG